MYVRSKEFHRMMVVPTVAEALARVTDTRLSFLATIVLNHLADYWAADTWPTEKDRVRNTRVREQMRVECPQFTIIEDVADAAKHCELRNDDRTVKHAGQVGSRIGTLNSIGLNHGIINAGAMPVEVWRNDARILPLAPALRAVAATWEAWIARLPA